MSQTHEIIARPNDREKWKAARMLGIGASEAAVAAGMSRYQTPLELYHLKRGEVRPADETDSMATGHLFEPFVRDLWRDMTGATVTKNIMPMARSKQFPFCLATPDYGVVRGSITKELLEIKCVESPELIRQLGEENSDELPEEWLMQTQQQAFVFDVEVVHVAVLVGRRVRSFRVERNQDLIEVIIDSNRKMWNRIKRGNPPDIDYRHRKAIDLMKRLYGVDETKTVELPSTITEMWEQYKDLSRQKDAIERERDALKAGVLHYMGDAHIGRVKDRHFEIVRREVPGRHMEYDVAPSITIQSRRIETNDN